jgi:DNA-binding NtrC family response regulator
MPFVTELSGHVLKPLGEGPDFTLYRSPQHGNPSPVLVVALTAKQPSIQSLLAARARILSYSGARSCMGLSQQSVASEPKSQPELSQKLAAQEKEMIEAALRQSGGRMSGPSGAAAKLGMPESMLESKIKSLKINKNRFKTAHHSTTV